MDDECFVQAYGKRDFRLMRGKGSYVWDEKGNKYLDCITGIAVNAMGHCHDQVTAAIRTQAETLIHGSNLYLLEPQQRLARFLVDNTGFKKVFLCNSGTEAVEAAIKFVRKYRAGKGEPERMEIISVEHSFHGRTYGALAATGQERLKEEFGPMPSGFVTVPLNDSEALKRAVSEKTAAMIIEPLLAEGGIISLNRDYVESINELREKGVLLICDEIQTGLGRTGELLACSGTGLKPDLVVLAKALGGGLPLGAVLLNEAVAGGIKKGDHGTTFGGNPVACAAGLEVLKLILQQGFMADIQKRSQYLRNQLEKWIVAHQDSGFELPVLGRGFLIGMKYTGNLDDFILRCRNTGLLLYRAGNDVIRLLPPLNISRSEIDEIIEKLDKSMES